MYLEFKPTLMKTNQLTINNRGKMNETSSPNFEKIYIFKIKLLQSS